MTSQHSFHIHLTWEANEGGTIAENGYSKNYNLKDDDVKTHILGSSAPAFSGSFDRYNPENLLIGSLASCHMLWFLYLAKLANIQVTQYKDEPHGILQLEGSHGRFTEISLRPEITITDPARIQDVVSLQEKAHEKCYIANSVNFPVKVAPIVTIQS